MGPGKQDIGQWGEGIACWYLEKRLCYVIQARHFTSRFGEIDIIAQDGDNLVFVEVKTRLGLDFGLPEEAVGYHKRRKLKRAILAYLSQNKVEKFRIDVVAITYHKEKGKVNIRHHKSLSDSPR